MNKIIQISFLLLLFGYNTQANNGDDGEKDTKKPSPTATRKQMKVSATAVLKQQAINALNSQLKGLNLSQSISFVPNTSFLAESQATAVVADQRDQAKTLFDYLKQNNKLIPVEDGQKAEPLDMTTLPIGLSKKVGPNNTVIVGFSRIVMKPNYAELTAFVKMEMMVEDGETGTKKVKEIFFGAEGIKMTNHGKIVGDARLVLLGDYTIPMFNGKMKLVMRGGSMSKSNGAILGGDKTFAVIDCDGFKEAGILADGIFDRSVMIPIDKRAGTPLKGEVTATLKINGGLKNFNDILGTLDFKTGFAITGHEKWGFVVQGMFFDASTLRNHGSFQYVNEYLVKHNDEIAELGVNTWRGVGLDKFEVMLPKEFKKKNEIDRVKIEANKLIFDKYGVSCDVGIAQVRDYDLAKGKTNTTNAWKMSLDRFYLNFDQSKLTGGKFGGAILLPSSKYDNDAYNYNAIIDLSGNYALQVNSMKVIDFEMFKATAVLTPQSYVELAVINDEFVPKAVLSGYFTMKGDEASVKKEGAATGADSLKGNTQSVTFNNLIFTTQAPFVSLESAGYNRQSKVANFPVTIDNFNASVNTFGAKTQLNLQGGMSMNLMGSDAESNAPEGFSVKSIFKIKAELDNGPEVEIHEWKFKEYTMKPAGLNASIGAYHFKGELEPFDDARGKGLKAAIAFSKDKKLVGAFAGIFGNKLAGTGVPVDTRYWLVEGWAPNVVLTSAGVITLKGIGGGVYHHLYPQQNGGQEIFVSNTFGSSVRYKLSDHKLGFKAVVGMQSTGTDSFKGMVGMEITFNKSWGLSSFGLFGNGTFAADFRPGINTPEFAGKLKSKFTELAQKATETPVGQYLSKSKLIEKANKEFNKDTTDAMRARSDSVSKSGNISFKVALLFDNDNDVFHGDGEIYINSAYMAGIGAGGRAGWFVLHADKKEWYFHAGSPTNRLGVQIGQGSFRLKSTAYLMVGHRIPPMSPPPPQIISLMGNNYAGAINNRDDGAIANGQGIAFGADVNMSTGEMRAAIFYAKFDAGAGLDVMLSKGNHACAGIDGWYAQGQAYAYVTGDIGITIKVAFVRKNISIFKGSAGVLLQAGLPNPAWFKGQVAGRYSVLGGAVKGNFNLQLKLGQECGENTSNARLAASGARVNAGQELSASNTRLILSTYPVYADSTRNYGIDTLIYNSDGSLARIDSSLKIKYNFSSVYTTPTITFNQAVETPFTIQKSGSLSNTYKLLQPIITLKDNLGNVVPFTPIFDDSKTILTVLPTSLLLAKKKYTLTVKTRLQTLSGSVWDNLAGNTRDIIDSVKIVFRTGDESVNIPTDNIAYSYPVDGQRFLYKGEAINGYIKLKRAQTQLASLSGVTNVVFNSDENEFVQDSTISNSDNISFPIPTGLISGKEYKYAIRNISTNSDTLILYEGKFRVSQYNTFQDKINSINNEETFIYKGTNGSLQKDVILLSAKSNLTERMDEIELRGSILTAGQPLVKATVDFNNNYYLNTIHPLIYKDSVFAGYGLSNLSKLTNQVLVSDWYVHNGKYFNELTNVNQRLPFDYSIASVYKKDFDMLRDSVAMKFVANSGFTGLSQPFIDRATIVIENPMPYFENGSYKIKIASGLPGTTRTEKKQFTYLVSGLKDDRETLFINNAFLASAILQAICPNPLYMLNVSSAISNGAKVKLAAKSEVTLDEGFETGNDVDVDILTEDCNN